MATKKKLIALSGATMLLLAACNPGADAPDDEDTTTANGQTSSAEVVTDISDAPEQTLVVWDQEVRGGQNEQMERLNAAFMEKYPNITIERNSQSFDDLQTTLRLALSGNDAPDVVQANNSRAMMGQFVTSNQIICLDKYSDAYGWEDRFAEDILSFSRYSDDAVTFGEGCLYGLPQVGEVVGIYYSPAKLAELGLEFPETWEELGAQLEEIQAAGETPLMLGNVEQWPAFHVFGPVQGAHEDADVIRTLGFGNPGSSWDTEANLAAAEELAGWAESGYFNEGFNGLDYDSVWQDFAKGEGVYLIAGSWLAVDLAEAMDDVRFALPPAGNSGVKASTGGTGLPFAVTSAAKDPNVAAAYIDFITSDEAMDILGETGNVPVNNTADYADATDAPVIGDTLAAFEEITTEGDILPYLDYATTTAGQDFGAAIQELLAGAMTPAEFVETLEGYYTDATE